MGNQKISKKSYGKIGLLTLILSAGLVVPAGAGGFSIKEQSAQFQGTSFAGAAAGGGLSSMFWNSAALSEIDQLTTDSSISAIFPDTSVQPTFVPGQSSNDIGRTAYVPASYYAMKLNDQINIGLAVTAPFGLGSKADDQIWFGDFEFRSAKMFNMNFNPVLSYKLSDWISVGAGVQLQYTKLSLKQAAGLNGPTADVTGKDWSWGFTAGMLLKPVAGTSIGIGYRSKLDVDLDGSFKVGGVRLADAAANLDLPEMVTVSLRQELSPTLRLLAT